MKSAKKITAEPGVERAPSTINEVPRICLFDLDRNIGNQLISKGFNCTSASLGAQIQIPDRRVNPEDLYLKGNSDYPENLHEYQILVFDLSSDRQVLYDPSMHRSDNLKGDTIHALISRFPERLFDPRPLAAQALRERVCAFLEKESIIVVFSSPWESIEYKFAEIKCRTITKTEQKKISNYSFLPECPITTNKSGRLLKFNSEINRIEPILKKHIKFLKYDVVFSHPTLWDGKTHGKVKNFIPLLLDSDHEIASYLHFIKKSAVFVFPQIADKATLLVDLFSTYCPEEFPSIFPYSTKFAWVENDRYQLPNQAKLLAQRALVTSEYEKKLSEIDGKIRQNGKDFGYLHDLLTQTDKILVRAVEHFLKWLGFPSVTNVDEIQPENKEEDLRVDLDDGLLVIEVKGIGGTSTDDECSQISKIRYRRCEDRNKFDVRALYIVNHQRYQPAEERTNPPFTANQIRDARNDKRGLLTTYELFKLFFLIEMGIISKFAARTALLGIGPVSFEPKDLQLLGTPSELLKNGTVAVLDIPDMEIHQHDEVVIRKSSDYHLGTILNIQIDGMDVSSARNTKVGLLLDCQIPKNAIFYLFRKSEGSRCLYR